MRTAEPSQIVGSWCVVRSGWAIAATSSGLSRGSAGTLPSKTIVGSRVRPAAEAASPSASSRSVARYFCALGVGEPDDLERVVAGEQAVLVVVDRFAGAGEQAGGGVFVAEDEVGVGLAALQGDAHRHLAERAAGERVGAGERLRTEQHVDAERAALPHEAVEQQRRVLGQLVVGDEQLLELVDDQQRARHRHVGHGAAEAGDVLHAVLAEQLAAAAQLLVEPLEHADAELALALDGDHPGVRQPAGGVGFELDALLEVDEVELDLVGAVVQRERW